MRFLLDTNILLWALADPDRLGKGNRDLIEDPANDILFSAASIWEIAIKSALGRADFAVNPIEIASRAVQAGFEELPILSLAAAEVMHLPHHHRDPFDRLLVAQAMVNDLRLLTADPVLPQYSPLVILV